VGRLDSETGTAVYRMLYNRRHVSTTPNLVMVSCLPTCLLRFFALDSHEVRREGTQWGLARPSQSVALQENILSNANGCSVAQAAGVRAPLGELLGQETAVSTSMRPM